jgi:UDP-2,4-diacetamido-2,4,6-trideoxy-beta-L-altropyranose hydrolase
VATKYIVFRVDASSQIGTGHFMRCLTLAAEIKKHGAQIVFISRNLPSNLSDLLKEKGIECIHLSRVDRQSQVDELPHSSWLGVNQTQDAQETIKAIGDQLCDWIIVDHYAIDERWEIAVQASCKKIMVIDDLADRQHNCHVLLDQNYYSDMQTRYFGKVPSHCQLLLGPRFALLRDEFRALRKKIKVRTGEVKKILVFFGGVDADNYTSLAMQALLELKSKLQVDVVIGAQHPNREQIKRYCISHGFICHVQTAQMAKLMTEADLGIGAGGTATWERCCLGLTSIVICIAENQKKMISDGAQAGFFYSVESKNNLVDVIRHHIKALIENPALIKHISDLGMHVVDGEGIDQVCTALNIVNLNSCKARECKFAEFNVLITSASKKIPLVKAMQNAVRKIHPDAKVIAGDICKDALSSFVADKFWVMPKANEENVLDIINSCHSNNIRIIFPTRDGELKFWAANAERFRSVGISVIVSPEAAINICIDKVAFSEFGELHKLPFIPSVESPFALTAKHFVVKERYGAGSRDIGLNLNLKQALAHARKLKSPIFQPYVMGVEISIDAWLNKKNKIKGLILRKREIVSNGESQVTSTFRNSNIELKIKNTLEALNLSGPVVLQAIIDFEGGLHVIECNARFGGASTIAITAGLDSLYWSLLESFDIDLDHIAFTRSPKELRQVRIAEDVCYTIDDTNI